MKLLARKPDPVIAIATPVGPVTIQLPAELADQLSELMPTQPLVAAPAITVTRDQGSWLLKAESMTAVLPPTELVAELLMMVNRHVVAVAKSLTLHAAAVTFDDRTATLIVGYSGAGKSTLAAHCVLAGAGLVSEEVSVIRDLKVLPFHRPIGIWPKEEQHTDVRWPLVLPSRWRESVDVTRILLVSREKNIRKPQFQTLSSGDATTLLSRHILGRQHSSPARLAELEHLAATALCQRAVYTEAKTVAKALQK